MKIGKKFLSLLMGVAVLFGFESARICSGG